MEDKKTLITIEIPDEDHLSFPLDFYQTKAHGVWVDWGDRSEKETFAEDGKINAVHSYKDPGNYTISIFAVDDTDIELIGLGTEVGYRNMVTSLSIGEDVTVIRHNAFYGCDNLEELSFVCEDIQLGEYAFADCTSLASVELPDGIGVIPLGLFFNCASLKTVKLPENIAIISRNAFYGCSQLKTVTGGYPEQIEDYAFFACRKLNSADFMMKTVSIGDGTFDNCNALRLVDLLNIKSLGNRAFCNCKALTKILLGENLTTIGERAFYNSSFTKLVEIKAATPPTLGSSNAFEGCDKDLIIRLPFGTKHKYAIGTNWTVYFNHFEEAVG